MKRRGYPINVSETKDRHGKYRLRFREKGRKTYYFKAKFGTPEFEIELQACREGLASAIERESRYARGTIGDLVTRYYESTSFKNGGPMTQRKNRGILDGFRDSVSKKGAKYADRMAVSMTFEAVDGILATKAEKHPAAARNLRKQLRRLFGYAVKIGIRPDNPVDNVVLPASRAGAEGFHAWTEAEIAKFRERHPLGTNARLAMELLLWTGQRRSDVVRMGSKDIEGKRIKVRQDKTGKSLSLTMAEQVKIAIRAMTVTGKDTFLVTMHGKPYTSNGFGNAFKSWCREAGIPHCSAHGLRKAMARRGAEQGATNQQLKAVGGWARDEEVALYTASANQPGLADTMIDLVSQWEANLLANQILEGGKSAEKGANNA